MKVLISVTLLLVFGSAVFAQTTAPATAPAGRRSIDFNADWRFSKSDLANAMMPAMDDASWRKLNVPHDWSIEGPFSPENGSGNGYAPGGIAWYRKHFSLDAADRGRVVAIEFDGVYANSQVYVNGFLAGGRPFGYASFECDLTPYLKFGDSENVVAVRVDHSRYADSRWYTGSGIYRNVRLRLTDALRVAQHGTFVTTPQVSDAAATVKIETTVQNSSGKARAFTVRSELLAADGRAAGSANATGNVENDAIQPLIQEIAIDRPQRWSIESPAMYALRTRVMDGETVVDETTTPFGVRTIQFDPDKGFFLNGQAMKIKGVCIHHDGGSVGAAVPEKVLERRLRLLKELGANAIRTAHNPPAPELLDLCDRLGLMVKDEAFDEFTPAKNKWVVGWNAGVPSRWGYAELFAQWGVSDMQDLVRRDRNHPSVIIWSIGNEIDYANDPFSHPALGNQYRPEHPPAEQLTRLGKPLVEAVKKLDPTRPVSAALANAPMSNAAGFAGILDIVGYNYQEARYATEHQEHPKRVIFGSENNHRFSNWTIVRDNEYVAGQFLWTGIDFLGEARAWPTRGSYAGLLDTCGFKKPTAWFRQSLWSEKPMVYLCTSPAGAGGRGDSRRREESWNLAAGSTAVVSCYTNCAEVELTLNDKPIGAKRSADKVDGVLSWSLPFEPGVLKAVGMKDGKPACEFVLKTAAAPSRIELLADTTKLRTDDRDVCHIEFRVTDANGVRVPNATHEVKVEISGPARLLGIDNGDMTGPVDYAAPQRTAANGRGLVIIQSTASPGEITVKATSAGLEPATLLLSHP